MLAAVGVGEEGGEGRGGADCLLSSLGRGWNKCFCVLDSWRCGNISRSRPFFRSS